MNGDARKLTRLVSEVTKVLAGTLVHQRARWGTLLGHQRNFEAWWKAEMAIALESWCWGSGGSGYGVLAEAKPRDFGVRVKKRSRLSVDLVVGPWDEEEKTLRRDEMPRVWIELKERAWWWGAPNKAFGVANHGLESDFTKLGAMGWSEGEAVLACQIMGQQGKTGEQLPKGWLESLNGMSTEAHRLIHLSSVGFPLGPGDDKANEPVRWASLVVYRIR